MGERRPNFPAGSMIGLMVLAAVVGIGSASLRLANPASLWFLSRTIFLALLAALVVSRAQAGAQGVFAFGFAAFGLGYFIAQTVGLGILSAR